MTIDSSGANSLAVVALASSISGWDMGRNSGCDDLPRRGQRIRIIRSAVQFCSSPAVSLSGRASVRAIRLADACRILGKSAKPRAALKPRLRRAFEGEAGSRRSGEGSSDLLGAAQEGLAGMADGLSDGVEEQKA